MQLGEHRLDGVTIIDVAGTLTADEPGRLKPQVAKAVLRGEKRLVLNLRDLTYVDSAGLGELVACYTRATAAEATIALAAPERRIYDLLALTRVLSLFDCFDSEADAVASFGLLAA